MQKTVLLPSGASAGPILAPALPQADCHGGLFQDASAVYPLPAAGLGAARIVVPYSTVAWETSVMQNIDVSMAQGCEHLVFVVGGRGERF